MVKISSEAIPWIMLTSVGVTFVSVIVACFSAGFSWRSSQVAANAAQATLYVKFQEEYASDKMREDLRKLKEWREEQGEDFAKKNGRSNGEPTLRRLR